MRGRNWISSDVGVLVLLALARLLLHALTNGQYGFHRDELAMLDDARYLAWGYVAYPPVTPLIARIALMLFGPSLVGVRFFSSLAVSVAMVLTGLMARELGGTRRAQLVAAVTSAIAPVSMAQGALFQYVSFDYLGWVLLAYLMIRLLKSENPRWWLGIGAGIGLGMMTKYTMVFAVAGVGAATLLTPARRYLKSPWLWGGVALSALIFLPNLIWQAQHQFVSLKFLSFIHTRDIAIGRTAGFLPDQLTDATLPPTLPVWIAGLYFYLFSTAGARYRALGWMFLVPFGLFLVAQGRGYYLGPAYPMLFAGGSVWGERWFETLAPRRARLAWITVAAVLGVGAVLSITSNLPVAPLDSPWGKSVMEENHNFREQVGWPELVQTVAGIYHGMPAAERARAGILASNYGEAGALNLYGPVYGLPEAICPVNSYWMRGYGDPPPQLVVVVGVSEELALQFFEQCELAGHVTNPYGVQNEETQEHPDILICRQLRQPWSEFWKGLQYFG